MTADPTHATPTGRRWLMPALFASLAVNLLVAGIAVGWLISPHRPPHDMAGDDPSRSLIGAPFVRALEDDDRRALLGDMRPLAGQLRENRRALRARFEALLDALQAEPFDASRVAALFAEQRDVALNRQEIGERLLIARLEAMTPSERAAYAGRLAEGLRRFRRD